jgi:NADH-quinone oxidoreductase subunit G
LINNNNFEIIFLFGQDDLLFKKQNEFIVYIGSHGDKGAQIANIVLPGSAYTENDGYYTNLEGKLQKAFRASYPPGEAKEDWVIINDLSELLKRKKLFNNKEELNDSLVNYLNLKNNKEFDDDISIPEFIEEKIIIDSFDYYYSNVIARSSKTMSECRNNKMKLEKTGTEG